MGKLFEEIMNHKHALITVIFIMLSVSIIFGVPISVIWALNCLFDLNIKYTWQTWLSVYIIWTFIAVTINKESSDKLTKDFWR
jgi:hypothetical protein